MFTSFVIILLWAVKPIKYYGNPSDDEECRSLKLPTGEVLYDPMDCELILKYLVLVYILI